MEFKCITYYGNFCINNKFSAGIDFYKLYLLILTFNPTLQLVQAKISRYTRKRIELTYSLKNSDNEITKFNGEIIYYETIKESKILRTNA